MTEPLYVSEEDPVNLNGAIESGAGLQIRYRDECLADYDQKLYAEHEDLEESTGVIRIKIFDFAHGGDDWEISVSHDPGGGTVTWTRDGDHAYYDFGAMTSEQQVHVTATSDASPPQNEQRSFHIKTTPIGAGSSRGPR
jgi:hypothetical protein